MLSSWYAALPLSHLRKLLASAQQALTLTLLVGEDDAEWDAFCKDTGPKCYAGLKWIQVLYNANCKRKALDRSQRVRKRPRLECIESGFSLSWLAHFEKRMSFRILNARTDTSHRVVHGSRYFGIFFVDTTRLFPSFSLFGKGVAHYAY